MPAQSIETLYWEKTIPAYILDFLEAPEVIHFPSSVLIFLYNSKLKNEEFHGMLFSVLFAGTTSLNSTVVNTVFQQWIAQEYLFIFLFVYLFVYLLAGSQLFRISILLISVPWLE